MQVAGGLATLEFPQNSVDLVHRMASAGQGTAYPFFCRYGWKIQLWLTGSRQSRPLLKCWTGTIYRNVRARPAKGQLPSRLAGPVPVNHQSPISTMAPAYLNGSSTASMSLDGKLAGRHTASGYRPWQRSNSESSRRSPDKARCRRIRFLKSLPRNAGCPPTNDGSIHAVMGESESNSFTGPGCAVA